MKAHIALAQDPDGKIRVLYAGTDVVEADQAYRKEAKPGAQVALFRKPLHTKRRSIEDPKAVAARAKTQAAAAAKAEAERKASAKRAEEEAKRRETDEAKRRETEIKDQLKARQATLDAEKSRLAKQQAEIRVLEERARVREAAREAAYEGSTKRASATKKDREPKTESKSKP